MCDEIRKLHDEMRDLRKAGKHEEIKRFATADAIFINPICDPMTPDQTLDFAKKRPAIFAAEPDVTIDDIKIIGDVAIDRSSFVINLPTGEKKGWQNKWNIRNLTVWVKEGGAWKIRNSCSTFRLPDA